MVEPDLYIARNSEITNRDPDEVIPYGIPDNLKAELLYGFNPKDKDRNRSNEIHCRYCRSGFDNRGGNGRRMAQRHEKNTCRFPGAPKHICIDSCVSPCAGSPPWTPQPDNRLAASRNVRSSRNRS